MPDDTEKKREQIKQQIDLYKENLKFLNSFYIPLLSGIPALFFFRNPISSIVQFFWYFTIFICIFALKFYRQEAIRNIYHLIEEL
jgi:hypothetical protein